MLKWLAAAARELREDQGRKLVHVGASADADQSTIYRFESALAWPRKVDNVINGYADDLDTRPIEIWRRALELWEADEAATAADAIEDAVAPLLEEDDPRRPPASSQPKNRKGASRRDNA